MPKPYPKEFREDVIRVARSREPGVRISTVVDRVSTQLSDGKDLGSLTAAEIHEMGTGEKLPE